MGCSATHQFSWSDEVSQQVASARAGGITRQQHKHGKPRLPARQSYSSNTTSEHGESRLPAHNSSPEPRAAGKEVKTAVEIVVDTQNLKIAHNRKPQVTALKPPKISPFERPVSKEIEAGCHGSSDSFEISV